MRNFEQELKLQLDAREYGILSRLTDAEAVLQTNYYFSSANLSPETMVRLREKEGAWLLCYKHRLQQLNGVSVCDERECEVDWSFAQSLIRRGIRPIELNTMLKTDFYENLTYCGKMDTYRTKFPFQEWVFELDKNEYLGTCDYELECECPNVQQLEKLKSFLSYTYGIVIRYSDPKVQRFFALLNK